MQIKLMSNYKYKPQIVFTEQAYYNMLLFYTSQLSTTKEFMFVGTVEKNKYTYVITDVYLIPQEANSGAFCETDDERYPAWLHETFPKIEDKKKVRLNGHSHVSMAVNPSGVDDQNIEKMMEYIDDFFIQLIINKRKEIMINLWDKANGTIFNDCDYYVQIDKSAVYFKDHLATKPELYYLPELKLEDFKPTKVPHMFQAGSIVINILKNKTYLTTDKLAYEPGKEIQIFSTPAQTNEMNKLFTKMVKEPKYNTYSYWNRPVNSLEELQEHSVKYDEDELYEDYYGFPRQPKKKGGKKNGR